MTKPPNETTMEYSTRLARAIAEGLIFVDCVKRDKREVAIDNAAEIIFAWLAMGDDPPPSGSP